MFRVNKITLFIFLGVDVTWQIQNIISILILDFLGLPGAFGFSLEISLGYGQGLPRGGWLGLPLLLPTGIASGFLGDCFLLATPESIFIFSISVFGGNFHHPIQGHFSGPTELQVQLSVLDAFFKGTNCLVIWYILNCVMQSDPPLDVIPQSFTRLLHTRPQFCKACGSLACSLKGCDKHSGEVLPSVDAARCQLI